MEEKIKQLCTYAALEGTELGEGCQFLVGCWERRDVLTDEFIKALEKEIDIQLLNFKENTTIVEVEIPARKVEVLEWIQ